MKYTAKVLIVAFLSIIMEAQVRHLSIDERLSPRADLLRGTAGSVSASKEYVITFPPPNQCIVLHAKAESRSEALYIAVSRGNFTLKPADSALTVWTKEEFDEVLRELPDFNKHCAVTP